MKRIILIGIMILGLLGCNSFVPRKDLYEKVEFNDGNIVQGRNYIDIYRVDYPADYFERLEFFKEFEAENKKLLLEDRGLNILISVELYRALERFKRGEFLLEEQVYVKEASDLDEFQKEEIDSSVSVAVTDRGGQIQKYLNKQVYFWMKVTNRLDEFNGETIYTELDKQRLIEDVRVSRKDLFKLLRKVRSNYILEVDNPYAGYGISKDYWASKEIDIFNPTGISREIQSLSIPLYIKNLNESDVRSIRDVRDDFNSKVVILEDSNLTGYTLRDDKYIFYHGGSVVRSYFKNYDIRVRIKDIDLNRIATIEQGILMEELLNKSKVTEAGIQEAQDVKKERSLDWGLN